jgi:hypothetical protein
VDLWFQSDGASADVSAKDLASQSISNIAGIQMAFPLYVIVRGASDALTGQKTFRKSYTYVAVVCPF